MNNIELQQLRQTSENSIARLTEKEVADVVGGGDQAVQIQNQIADKISNKWNNYDFGGIFGGLFGGK
jgi:hypothetical protein